MQLTDESIGARMRWKEVHSTCSRSRDVIVFHGFRANER
jgi:hypothetical protein